MGAVAAQPTADHISATSISASLFENPVTLPVCRGYRCTSTDLIEGHIVARGFARDAQESYRHNLLISIGNVRPLRALGIYDNGILCADRDGKLGDLDNDALQVCRRFQAEHTIRDDGLFEMQNVDGPRFATFVLSVLWRASITSRPEFAKVSLGQYEDDARDVIFGAKSLAAMPDYQLLVGRYRQTGKFNPARNYTVPAKMTTGLTGWYFALNGFRILAKFSPMPLAPECGPAIVNGNDRLIGAFVNYESTTEGQAVIAMARAAAFRSARP